MQLGNVMAPHISQLLFLAPSLKHNYHKQLVDESVCFNLQLLGNSLLLWELGARNKWGRYLKQDLFQRPIGSDFYWLILYGLVNLLTFITQPRHVTTQSSLNLPNINNQSRKCTTFLHTDLFEMKIFSVEVPSS